MKLFFREIFLVFLILLILSISGCVGVQGSPELKESALNAKQIVDVKDFVQTTQSGKSASGNPQLEVEEKILEETSSKGKFVEPEKIELNAPRIISSGNSSTITEQEIEEIESGREIEDSNDSEAGQENNAILPATGGSNQSNAPEEKQYTEEYANFVRFLENMSKIESFENVKADSLVKTQFFGNIEPNGKSNAENFFEIAKIVYPIETELDSMQEADPVQIFETVKTDCNGVHSIESVPLFDQPQKINFFVFFEELDTTVSFAVEVNPESQQPLIAMDQKFDNPTLNVYTTEQTVKEIFSSQNPLPALVTALNQGKIALEGTDVATSIKILLGSSALNAITSEGQGLVEEQDCDKIKKRWIEIQQKLNGLNCEKIKELLEQARQKKDLLEKQISEANERKAKTEKEIDKWQKEYSDLLEMLLKDSGYTSTQPSDPQNWGFVGIPRRGVKFWLKDGGDKLVDVMQKWKKEFDAIRQKIENAYAEKEFLEKLSEQNNAELNSTVREIGDLENQSNQCEKERSSLESEAKELEKLYKKCLEKLLKQKTVSDLSKKYTNPDFAVQLENYRTEQNLVSKFNELDKEISDLQQSLGKENSECKNFEQAQSDAKKALDAAKNKREEAAAKQTEGHRAYLNGELDKAEKLLNDATKDLLEEAKKLAAEAKEKARRAIEEKQNCKMDLQREKMTRAEKEKEKAEWLKKIAEKNTVEDEPANFNKTSVRIGMDWALAQVLMESYEKNSCDCPYKAIRAARILIRDYASEMVWKLGIGVIQAPIDALSPESFLRKAAQKIASHVLSFLGSDSFGEYAQNAVISEAVGAILPKTEIDLIDKSGELGATSGISKTLDDVLSKDIQIWEFEKKIIVPAGLCAEYECNVKVVIITNSKTRNAVAIIKGDCCPNQLIILNYKTNKDALPEGTVDMKVFDERKEGNVSEESKNQAVN